MQEVFEKIIERLDAKKQYFQKFYDTDGNTEEDENINKATQLAFDDAKSIVQEVAEEYNGGWIPCSERLPEANVLVMTTNNIGIVQIAYLSKYGNFVIEDDGDKYVIQVVAWQQLPEPYQTNGE